VENIQAWMEQKEVHCCRAQVLQLLLHYCLQRTKVSDNRLVINLNIITIGVYLDMIHIVNQSHCRPYRTVSVECLTSVYRFVLAFSILHSCIPGN